MRWSHIALVLVACLLAAGCTAPDTGTGEEPPLTLTISHDKTTLGEEDRLTVIVALTNDGEEGYTYEHPGCPPEPFEIQATGHGEEVRLYAYGQEGMAGACAVREATIPAGESIETTVHWNGHTEPAQPDPHAGDRVDPGEYVIHAELRRADSGPTFAQESPVQVT